jgi:6-phosphogluconate dehydrogenase
VPAGVTETVIDELAPLLARGDTIIDGGNTFYGDDMARSAALAGAGIDYIDCGTSGGVWGLERGFCLMIGGPDAAVTRLDPIFRALAPGIDAVRDRTPGRKRSRTGEMGYLHCGPSGGPSWKMVHNGIEYAPWRRTPRASTSRTTPTSGRAHRRRDRAARPRRHPFTLEVANAEVCAEAWCRRGCWTLTARARPRVPRFSTTSGRAERLRREGRRIESRRRSTRGAGARARDQVLRLGFISLQGEARTSNRSLSALRSVAPRREASA